MVEFNIPLFHLIFYSTIFGMAIYIFYNTMAGENKKLKQKLRQLQAQVAKIYEKKDSQG